MPNYVEAIAALLLLSIAACNTTEGFGEDVESAGDAIENTAEDASN